MRKKNNNKSHLSLIDVYPKTEKQSFVLNCKNNMVLKGSAGTGKTYLASAIAYKELMRKNYEQVLFIRSTVSTRDIGFLPGTEKDKTQVYKWPYINTTNKLFSRGDAWDNMERHGLVRFEPTSFVRGCEFVNTFVIVDESQNMTYHELDSLITRLDEDCRIIFCGDTNQADLPNNGFASFCKVLNEMEEFNCVEFYLEDIIRSELVKSYLTRKDALLSNRQLSI